MVNKKEHIFKSVGYAFDTARFHCFECGAEKLDNNLPHHYPSWIYIFLDCNIAKDQIKELDLKWPAKKKK